MAFENYTENLLLRKTPCQILSVNDYEHTHIISMIGIEKLGSNPRFIETEFVRLCFFIHKYTYSLIFATDLLNFRILILF